MILYCPNNHEFTLDEAQQAFAKDRADGNHDASDVQCPTCQSTDVYESCVVPECTKPRRPNRDCFCSMHRARKERHGSPHIFLRDRCTPAEPKFWSKVKKTDDSNECWIWQGGTNSAGYGKFRAQGKFYYAHRFSLFLKTGVWPNDFVLHSCDNPRCVNPQHLREGTAADNAQDKVERGRVVRGTHHPQCKLDEAIVNFIRASSDSPKALAEKYNISSGTIGDIRRRKSWRHI